MHAFFTPIFMENEPKIMIGELEFIDYRDALEYVEKLDQSELEDDKSSIIAFLQLHLKIEQLNGESSQNRRKELELKCKPLFMQQISSLTPEEFDEKIIMFGELSVLQGYPNKLLSQLVAIDILEMEVNNGGFHQYFLNTENKYSIDATNGLNLIGALEHLILLEKAIEVFNKYWENDELSMEKMGELDDEFYKLESIQQQRKKYIFENRKDFEQFLQ